MSTTFFGANRARKSLILRTSRLGVRSEVNFSANFVGRGHLFCHIVAGKFAEKTAKSLICMDPRGHLFCEPTRVRLLACRFAEKVAFFAVFELIY
ncbi:hypothetical protein J2785_003372 [Burkholderia ambifaria]|nr:hypothetical protein [Burkholderia ambifaria]MDR6500216.1 hypothetical protein [Burkholderia ambifaria]